MAPSRSAVGRRDAPPQRIYSTGETLNEASKAGAYTFIRVSGLLCVDFLATFAIYVIINYLTNVWNLSMTHASGIINIWNGITAVLCIVFAVFADTFMDSYYLLVLSSTAYSIGLGLLCLSTPIFFGPCNEYKEECIGHKQKVLFFIALPLIGVGRAGHIVSLSPFLDAQTREDGAQDGAEEDRAKDEDKKLYLQIPDLMMALVVVITGSIALPYIKPWSIRFGIPAICTLTATGLFLTGSASYKRNKPEGSLLTTVLRVFIASGTKDFQQVQNFKQIYNDDDTRCTNSLRCLDKAAIKFPDQAKSISWTLCTVREVEDTKVFVRMVPMCLPFIVIGLVFSIQNTYFLEQANHMDHKLGSINIQIPIFLLFYTFFRNICTSIYDVFPGCFPRHYAPRGIAIGMILSVLSCITAAIVEAQRLDVIRDHGLVDKSKNRIPMSVFSLLPQFLLLGGADGIVGLSFRIYLKHQAPGSMYRYMLYFRKCLVGLGSMGNVLLVYVLGKVNPKWFQYTSNKSRLDLYYWTLAVISAVNLVVYVVACFYMYPFDAADDDEVDVDEDGRNA